MMNIFLYSHNPFHHALVGAIGALITYLIYWGISLLIAFIRGRKGKNEDTIEMNQNKGIVSEAKESTNDMKSEEIEHMYCQFCGKQIEKDAIYCSHCGKKLSADSQMNPQINNLVGWGNLRSNKVGKWGKRLIIILISAGTILGLFCLGVWIYDDFYLPSHYESHCESLYEEGMRDVNKADKIALELYRHNETKAIEVLTNSAEKGNVKSMVLLGRYYKGYGFKPYSEVEFWDWENIPEDCWEKSSYWFLQAAKLGNAEAQGELGHNYKYGLGVKQDFDKAIYWTKQGADNGDAVAQWRMGNLYESGLAYYRGYFTDYQIWWYNRAGFRAKDNPNVQMDRQYVAEMKSREPEQVFLAPNIKKAKHYWKLAANQGFREAKSSLEKIYEGDE